MVSSTTFLAMSHTSATTEQNQGTWKPKEKGSQIDIDGSHSLIVFNKINTSNNYTIQHHEATIMANNLWSILLVISVSI